MLKEYILVSAVDFEKLSTIIKYKEKSMTDNNYDSLVFEEEGVKLIFVCDKKAYRIGRYLSDKK